MAESLLPRKELRISITSLCNLKCVYCHNEGNHKPAELSVSLVKKLVNSATKFGLESVRLTGGEPLLHKDIKKICKVIKNIDSSIKIGINTNGILIDKLMELINKKYIDRVVVGIDYFDNDVSKNSPIGVPSQVILENIIRIHNKNILVEITKTFNNDLENTILLTEWAVNHNIPIKILEIVDNEVADTSSDSYLDMRKKVIERFSLNTIIDDSLNEVHGYIKGKRLVSFYQSHCRLRECEFCKNLHMRVTSAQKFKPCLLNKKTEIAFTEDNIDENLVESLKYLGVPPSNK